LSLWLKRNAVVTVLLIPQQLLLLLLLVAHAFGHVEVHVAAQLGLLRVGVVVFY